MSKDNLYAVLSIHKDGNVNIVSVKAESPEQAYNRINIENTHNYVFELDEIKNIKNKVDAVVENMEKNSNKEKKNGNL